MTQTANQYHDGDFIHDKAIDVRKNIYTNDIGFYINELGILYKISS